ncbi:hypothetical protein MVEG_01919 [Podila verticillata NRRL 6337]|nr:hypothetical protein MVEG_01919 [Podila verticillata NRRL 6337]
MNNSNNKFYPVDPTTSNFFPPPSRLGFGGAGLMALAQFSHRLTSLDVGQASAGKIQSRSVQAFLQQCSTLVHLRVRSGCIQVTDMVHSPHCSPSFESTLWDDDASRLVPWACTGLQTLSVAFSISELASPFFTHTYTNNTSSNSSVDPLDTMAKLQQQHHHQAWAESMVFKQLSLLTNLQVLEIKSSFMRLILSTGFELLSSLTDLREFSMAGPNIGGGGGGGEAPSLYNETMNMWFTKHWAHVKSIQVASRDRVKLGPGSPMLTALHNNIPQHPHIPIY